MKWFLLLGLFNLFVSMDYVTCKAVARDRYTLRRQRRQTPDTSIKLNRQYQECIGPESVQGHCKHLSFCPMNTEVFESSLEYLCIIENRHVGVCCPDDILLNSLRGAQMAINLPAEGYDYTQNEKNAGCGLGSLAETKSSNKKHNWPWLASIIKIKDNNFEPICSGSIITDQHILTAAHCFTGLTPQQIKVRLGEYNFDVPNETRYKDFDVEEIRLHEEFNAATYENDIAILALKKPTHFNTYIWPICLPPLKRSFTNETVIVAGWGQQYYAGPRSNTLLEISIPVWDQNTCAESFTQRITDNNLCAAAYDGSKDACQGDSGGPLLYKLDNNRWVTIGIISWGIGCGTKGRPGIYTRVNQYKPWILKHTVSSYHWQHNIV